MAVGVEGDPVYPVFGNTWLLGNFVYFGVVILRTVCLDYNHQAYQVIELSNEEENAHMKIWLIITFSILRKIIMGIIMSL